MLSRDIKASLSDSFPETFWIVAEISEFHLNKSGHAYLDLIEKDPDSNQIKARMRATIWAYTFRMLRPYFEANTGYQLSSGIKIMVSASLVYHPQYSISINIKDIDPAYTLGDLARKKAEITEKLTREGVIDMNKELPLPLVPQRLAVISSETAAGYGDFINSLAGNPHGIHFHISLFPAIMQGDKAEESIIEALEHIFETEEEFDVVVLIRGGGAQIELECFNNYDLAYFITQFPLPVFTGIGHERDDTITDQVAAKKLKTPTAVAEYLIDRCYEFLEKLDSYSSFINNYTRHRLIQEKDKLSLTARQLVLSARKNLQNNAKSLNEASYLTNMASRSVLEKSNTRLDTLKMQSGYKIKEILGTENYQLGQTEKLLRKQISFQTENQKKKLDTMDRILSANHPDNILSKGFSITLHKGKAVINPEVLKPGDKITSILFKGKINSEVK